MAATLQEARRWLGRRLRAFEMGRTGLRTGPATFVGKAAGTEARRRLISSDLEATARGGAAPRDATDRYDAAYVYLPSMQEQRRVVANGYGPSYAGDDPEYTDANLPTQRFGMLTVQRPWSLVLPAGLEYEVHFRLPVLDADGLPGLHSLINRALQRLQIVKRVSIAGQTNTYRYDLSSLSAWLTHPNQLGQVYLPDPPGPLVREPDPMPGHSRLRFDGATPYLLVEYPVPTGQSFSVDFYRPAASWIRSGNVWGDSQAGLVYEDDAADVPLHVLTLVSYAFACQALARRDPHGQEATWAAEAELAARAALPYLKWGEEEIPRLPRHRGWGRDNPRWLRGRGGLVGGRGGWP